MSDWQIPLSDLDYGAEEQTAVARVLQSRWLSMGPEVEAFEHQFARLLGVKHAIAVANGTAALHLAYLALGIGSGDEVIQPAINFVAAANTAVAVGAVPVFADISSLERPVIEPAAIERSVTPRTKAVVVMHYGGTPAPMAEIVAICQRHHLALVEDACHAVGARYLDPQKRPPHGTMTGALGDIGCFSFFSNKNLATGEGGMLVTQRDDLAERLRRLRSHGMTTLTWDRHRGHASSYDVVCHGYNYRLDELHAALGQAQLAKLPRNNQSRQQLVAAYHHHLRALPAYRLTFPDPTGDSACHLMVVVARDESTRAKIAGALTQARIQTSLHYPCVPDFTAFARFPRAQVETSRLFARRAITLPLFPTMTEAQVATVCRHVYAAAGDVAPV